MTIAKPRYVLLAAIDETISAPLVITQAASMARAIKGAELHLLHVADRSLEADRTNTPFDFDRHRAYLDERAREAQAACKVTVVGHVIEGDPADEIVRIASSIDADLVVVGTADKRGPERWLLGSVAQRVMQRAACPVLVVREKDHALSHAPEIEPPCPDCLREQQASGGAKLWCARHSQHHPRAHLHYAVPDGFGAGSSLIRP